MRRFFSRADGDASPTLVRRVFVEWWEFWLVVALTAFAAFLRLYQLADLPYGFHGDEANVLLDSKQIADDGWIGVWSIKSLGYPIAVNYFIAPFVAVMGQTVLAVRLPIAIIGIAAVPLCYQTIRNVAGWRAALCGTLLMIVSLWHLHLSRMGIPVGAWVVMEFGTLLCLQYGIKTRKWWWFLGSGLLMGLGLWIYLSIFIFNAAVGVYLVGWLAWQWYRKRNMTVVRDGMLVAILGLGALFAGWPMITFIRETESDNTKYEAQYIFSATKRRDCEAKPPEQRDAKCLAAMVTDTSERVDLVWHNARELMYTRFIVRGFPDPIDGLGARPPLGKVTGYLAIVGAVVALVRFRSKESVIIGLITIPVLALATSLTYDGQYRRCLGMLPFVMMFAGMTLGTVWEMAERQGRLWGVAAALLCAATIGYGANQSLSFYFGGTFQDEANTRFVFAPEARRAWEYIDTLEDPWVYFYDTRRSILYETRGALDTDLAGAEDRSLEFAPEGERTKLRFDLQPSEKVAEAASVKPRSAVFVFLNSYTAEPNIQEVIRRYPGGVLVEHRYEKLGFYDFRAYYLPPDLLDSYARQESVSYPLKSEVTAP